MSSNLQNSKNKSKKSTGRQNGGPYACTTTHSSSGNKSTTKTLIEYDMDESLDIKKEIIQDPEKTTSEKRNKTYESKISNVYIRKGEILDIKHILQTRKEQEIQESKQEKKYRCEKCARTYKNKSYLSFHQKFECGLLPQFSCKFCNKKFKRKFVRNDHVDRVHHKASSKKSAMRHYCDLCTRSYKWSKNLCRHKRIDHAAVQPQFNCDVCDYKAKRKYYLTRHIISKHLEK
ncbi:zinc finger protein 816-like [Belonocnema kinseyi]|uniref:zinc finger protein 816-like n=1 Tax=Belonocnema kinseyi TaxID=2817044 RepID=UPI00143E0EBB|nr:zinc finger protein 816-like [Belonocnema kinseyi]